MFEARRRRRRLAEATANSRPTGFWVLLVRAGNSEAIAEERFERGPCRRCVTGAVPSGPLFLPRSAARAVKKAQPAVLLGSHQVLMHASLLERLDAARLLEGLSRRPVRVASEYEATQYEHVRATSVLPPLDLLTVGVELDESLPPCAPTAAATGAMTTRMAARMSSRQGRRSPFRGRRPGSTFLGAGPGSRPSATSPLRGWSSAAQ